MIFTFYGAKVFIFVHICMITFKNNYLFYKVNMEGRMIFDPSILK